MVFPFTFTSMLPYPFYSAQEVEQPAAAPSPIQSHWLRVPPETASTSSAFVSPSKRRLPRPPRRVFEDDGVQPVPLQRKRGWEPAAPTVVVEPATTSRPVVGRFDTQAQYLRSQKLGQDRDGRLGRDSHEGKPPIRFNCQPFASRTTHFKHAMDERRGPLSPSMCLCTPLLRMLTPTSIFLLSQTNNPERSLPMSSSFFKSVDMSPPAPKRRRLGETILETALNAALIGTAVGLTAFRL